MLKHASRSRHIDPDRPPVAAGGLRSQIPDLVHGPRELLDCRQLPAGWSTRTDPLLRQEVEGGHRLDSFSYHIGPSEPQLTRAADGLRARSGYVSSQQLSGGATMWLPFGAGRQVARGASGLPVLTI